MGSQISLLIVLDPVEAFNVDASEAKLKELTVMMDKKWRIHLISSKAIYYRNLTCDFQVHPVGILSSPDSLISRIIYLLFSIRKGVSITKKYHIPIIMSKDGHLHLGLVAYAIKRITNRKCIIRVNEDDVLAFLLFIRRLQTPILSHRISLRILELLLRKIENRVFKLADCVLTHGPTDFQRIGKVTNRIDFVPLWVDRERFKPMKKNLRSQMRRELLRITEDETKVVLFVGRLHPEKDIETLLYGFGNLLEVRKDVILAIIGDGPEEEKYKQLANKLSISTKVKFLGYVPRNKMPKYFGIADVYVLTSIWEELSNTILEAMACRVPVIATAVGGNPYLVKDGETGFLIPPKGPDILSKKIAYALDHYNEMDKMASKALLSVRKFDKHTIGRLYKEKIFELLLQKHAGLESN